MIASPRDVLSSVGPRCRLNTPNLEAAVDMLPRSFLISCTTVFRMDHPCQLQLIETL